MPYQTSIAGIAEFSNTVKGAYVDAQRRDVTLTLPTTDTPFVWDVEVSDTASMYDPTTGVITFPFTGMYTFNFSYNASSASSTKSLYSEAQVFTGGVWVVSTYSLRQMSVRSGEESQVLYVSTNRFVAGTILRFATWASGGVDITIDTVVSTTGIIPAARLLITGIATL